MNFEAMQKSLAYERPDDADCRVADEPESVAPHDLARPTILQ